MKNNMPLDFWEKRKCFLRPIPAINEAAELLSRAVDAVLVGNETEAEKLIVAADIPDLWEYMQKLAASTTVEIHRFRPIADAPEISRHKLKMRMPSKKVELDIFKRDGWHCRFCESPVIFKEARKHLNNLFPRAARWGRVNKDKHLGLAVLESTLDHLLPHSRGGDHSEINLVTACGPCQFGRGSWTLEEVGLENPMLRPPIHNDWDGLMRLL